MGGCRASGTLIGEQWGGARYSPRWSCSQLPKGPGHTQVHTHTHKNIHISLFLKAPKWKDRHWCPLIREQINKSWHIHIMEYLLSHEKNKLPIHLMTWMTLKNADTTERIQTKNAYSCYMVPFLEAQEARWICSASNSQLPPCGRGVCASACVYTIWIYTA